MSFSNDAATLGQARVLAAMVRLESWIAQYVSLHLGPGVSPFDYLESLERRLAGRVPLSDGDLDEEVKTNVRYLVRENRRAALNRQRRFFPIEEAGDLADARPEGIPDKICRQQEARELLALLDREVAGWVEQLYGFRNEELSRSELAQRLGISRNTLNAWLSRKYRKLRAKLSQRSKIWP